MKWEPQVKVWSVHVIYNILIKCNMTVSIIVEEVWKPIYVYCIAWSWTCDHCPENTALTQYRTQCHVQIMLAMCMSTIGRLQTHINYGICGIILLAWPHELPVYYILAFVCIYIVVNRYLLAIWFFIQACLINCIESI